MNGIYIEDFKKFLEDNLGKVKLTSKNLITVCPYCEMDKTKKHYHLYISLEAPMFHCFHSACKASGTISKLIKKINGVDSSEKFIDRSKIKEYSKIKLEVKNEIVNVVLPNLNEDLYSNKSLYIKKRLKFQNINLNDVNGLVFDINNFININNVKLDDKMSKMRDYIHSNFVGFLTEHKSVLMCRNINETSKFKHLKIKIQETDFLDYYRIGGYKYNSTSVILAEGFYDIYNESIFDTTNLKKESLLYACALSASYPALLESIVYNENIYKLDVAILSDRDVPLDNYKKLKYYKSHLINSLTVWYNRCGKDFAMSPCIPERFVL